MAESDTRPFSSRGTGQSKSGGCTQLQKVRKCNHIICLGKSDILGGQNCPNDDDCYEEKKQGKGDGVWGAGFHLTEMVRKGLSDMVTFEERSQGRERGPFGWGGDSILQRIQQGHSLSGMSEEQQGSQDG